MTFLSLKQKGGYRLWLFQLRSLQRVGAISLQILFDPVGLVFEGLGLEGHLPGKIENTLVEAGQLKISGFCFKGNFGFVEDRIFGSR